MMNRLSTVLQNAFDALAPPAPLHEDFVYHWKRLMRHYLDVATTNKVAIELTNIPAHLDQLGKILLKEDSENAVESGGGEMGPCLEYLLKHNMLDLLATLAASDDPPGMRQYVLCFVTHTLAHLRAPILAHNAVFPALQRLIGICNGSCPKPSETDEIRFLFALSAQIRKNPQLVHVYITQDQNESPLEGGNVPGTGDSGVQEAGLREEHPPSVGELSSDGSGVGGTPKNPLFRPLDAAPSLLVPVAETPASPPAPPPPPDPQPATPSDRTCHPSFPLISALISYINSADSGVRVKACQGIMLLTSLPDDKFGHLIVEQSPLCESLALKLTALYLEIPPDTDPNNVDDMHSTWGLDSPVPLEVEESCTGCRQAVTFLGWLDFCDQVTVEGQPAVAEAVAHSVRELFLDQEFDPELLPNNLVLALLTKCFRAIKSPQLIKVFGEYVVGDLPGVTCRNLSALLDLCAHPDSAISLEALRFFEVVLEKNIEHVINCLVLTYVNRRGYYDNTLTNHIDSWSDEEDARERHRGSPEGDSAASASRTMASSHIDKIIQSFLSVVPAALRSAPSLSEASYQQYVSESQRQYSLVVTACAPFHWPVEAVSDDTLSSHSAPEEDLPQFNEGPFLRMIFSRIRNLPNQAYEVNLQLTAVISRLALLPHPYLHEYLLDTGVPQRPHTDTLLAALSDTASALHSQVAALPDHKRLLQDTRHRLLGHTADDREDYCNLLESVIVLEEVCKELAAIAFVKCQRVS